MNNQCKVVSVLLLVAVFSVTLVGCAGHESGARVTPAFVAASGAKVYVHPPKDQILSSSIETYIDMELERLGFTVVEDPHACDLLAYYSYSYDWDEPSCIHDFLIVFKPYPGDDPALLASASCYNRCSRSSGKEVHKAFAALRKQLNAAGKTGP